MTNEINPTSQFAAEPGSDGLFNKHFGAICELMEADDRLTAFDYNRLTDDIAGDVRRDYRGLDDDEAFLAWIVQAVQKRVQFYLIRRECETAVLAGIRKVVFTAEDLSQYKKPEDTVRELAEEAWDWIWQHWGELLASPEDATWRTRLWKRGYWTGRAWKTSQLRHRERFQDVEDVGRDERGKLIIIPKEEFEFRT